MNWNILESSGFAVKIIHLDFVFLVGGGVGEACREIKGVLDKVDVNPK